MSLHATTKHIAKNKGILAAASGIGLLITGVFAATACCWVPALIITLGLGSIIGVLHGASTPLIAAGVLLLLGGSIWQWRKRGSSCEC